MTKTSSFYVVLIYIYFQVDLLKDQVEEVEEQAALVLKELRAKTHDYELLKRDHAESVRAVQLLQAALTEQQAMLQVRYQLSHVVAQSV